MIATQDQFPFQVIAVKRQLPIICCRNGYKIIRPLNPVNGCSTPDPRREQRILWG